MLSFVLKSNSYGTLPLKHAPIGWDSMKYEFKRSADYFGITKEISIEQLGFIKAGRGYILNVLKNKGIEEEVILEVYEERNFKWELSYTGKLDLKEYEKEDEVLYVDVEQSGFTMKFLNQDEVPINILNNVSLKGTGLTLIEPVEVPLHSKVINKTYEGGITDEYMITDIFVTEEDEIHSHFSFQDIISNELMAYNYLFGLIPNPEDVFEMIDIEEDGDYTFDIDHYLRLLAHDLYVLYPVTISIDMQINDDARVRVLEEPMVMELAVGVESMNEYGVYHTKKSKIHRLLYNDKFTFKAGDKIKLYITFKVKGDSSNYYLVQFKQHPTTLEKTKFKIIGETTATPTTCIGQLPFETFTRVCEAITDQTGIFESTLLGRTDSVVPYDEDGDASLYLCTDGKQIRKLPIEDHPLTFNFKDLFNSFDAKHNIGVGIEKREGKEVIVIEKKSYFFSNEMIADLGQVNDIHETLAIDYFNNTIKIGYEEFENEVVNGIDEIASETQYSTPITQVKNEYKKLSPYRSDGYGIETARRLSDSPTSDSNYDEDNFLICLLRNGEGFESENDSEFDYIENVISPSTIYNGRDTPARMLRRHGNMIKAGLLKHQFESLKHVKGKNNIKMTSKLSSETVQIAENADVLISELEDPFIIPEFHEFENKAKSSLMRLIEAKPYGYLKYSDKNNIEYKGYVQSVIFGEGKASFKLILKNG